MVFLVENVHRFDGFLDNDGDSPKSLECANCFLGSLLTSRRGENDYFPTMLQLMVPNPMRTANTRKRKYNTSMMTPMMRLRRHFMDMMRTKMKMSMENSMSM